VFQPDRDEPDAAANGERCDTAAEPADELETRRPPQAS
jgi:hypothetical protein